MIRITKLSEIIEEKNGTYYLLKKDLSNCDLSSLDLSKIPPDVWEGAKFENTNFEGTNIKFYPHALYKYDSKNSDIIRPGMYYSLKNCNFTNCDLSYLSEDEFSRFREFIDVIIEGCNFTGTGLDIDLSKGNGMFISYFHQILVYKNVILSKEMEESLVESRDYHNVDIQTVMKNPNLYIPSNDLFEIIKSSLPHQEKLLSSSEINMYLRKISECLTFDKQGILVELYEKIRPYLKSSLTKLRFFQGIVENIQFDKIDFGETPYNEIIHDIRFIDCSFNDIIMFSRENDWYSDIYNRFDVFDYCHFNHVHLTNILPDSWKNIKGLRLQKSPVTFRKNLYVELGRSCNAKCKFCRNQFLSPCKYDLERIKKELEKIAPYMNSIVLGGGEPTLNMDVLKSILHMLRYSNAVPYVFTNGTMSDIDDLIYNCCRYKYHINISRHHYDSEKNASIFGLPIEQIWDDTILEEISSTDKVTMCATCFQGGLDTPDALIEYIKYVQEFGGKSVLFQTLHEDLKNPNENLIKPIENDVFKEVIEMLELQGFKKSLPIYSTGDYRLLLLSRDKMNISFKQYITEKELQEEWYRAVKRTFDLSMDPSGEIYQNWHQSYGKVNTKHL